MTHERRREITTGVATLIVAGWAVAEAEPGFGTFVTIVAIVCAWFHGRIIELGESTRFLRQLRKGFERD